jgi:hypothetical protein
MFCYEHTDLDAFFKSPSFEDRQLGQYMVNGSVVALHLPFYYHEYFAIGITLISNSADAKCEVIELSFSDLFERKYTQRPFLTTAMQQGKMGDAIIFRSDSIMEEKINAAVLEQLANKHGGKFNVTILVRVASGGKEEERRITYNFIKKKQIFWITPT